MATSYIPITLEFDLSRLHDEPPKCHERGVNKVDLCSDPRSTREAAESDIGEYEDIGAAKSDNGQKTSRYFNYVQFIRAYSLNYSSNILSTFMTSW